MAVTAVNLSQAITFVLVMVAGLTLGALAPEYRGRWVRLRQRAGGPSPEGRSTERVLVGFAAVMAVLVLVVLVLGAVRVAAP